MSQTIFSLENDNTWSAETTQFSPFLNGRALYIEVSRLQDGDEQLAPVVTFTNSSSVFEESFRQEVSEADDSTMRSVVAFDASSLDLSGDQHYQMSFTHGGEAYTVSDSLSDLDIEDQGPLHFEFIPIEVPDDVPGDIDPQTVITRMVDLLPLLSDTEFSLAETLDFTEIEQDPNTLLENLFNYVLDNRPFSRSRHYIGVLPTGSQPVGGACGLAYLGGQVSFVEQPGECDEWIYTHEVGHNLNLAHAPGCNAENPDQDYPYEMGTLGEEDGYLISTQRYLPGDGQHYDVMGYCNSLDRTFISRYHYKISADHVVSVSPEPEVVAVATRKGEAPTKLLISGYVDQNGIWHLRAMRKTNASVSKLRALLGGLREPTFTLALDNTGAPDEERFQTQVSPVAVAHSDQAHWFGILPLVSETKTRVSLRVQDGSGRVVLSARVSAELQKLADEVAD